MESATRNDQKGSSFVMQLSRKGSDSGELLQECGHLLLLLIREHDSRGREDEQMNRGINKDMELSERER